MKFAIKSMHDLGLAIRAVRKSRRVRQDQLAAAAGVSGQFTVDAEKGKPTVQFDRVLRLLRELGIGLHVEIPDTAAQILSVLESRRKSGSDPIEPGAPLERFPLRFDRAFEEELLLLCAARDFEVGRWRALGPDFFMAGLAIMLASLPEFDRPRLLALGEQLYPGSSKVQVFNAWLDGSPLRPSRFIPMLQAALRHAA